MIEITILAATLLVALVTGFSFRRRSGALRQVNALESVSQRRWNLLAEAGVRGDVAAVMHFSADWCGPCAAVRRSVATATATESLVRDIEVDIDENPALARELGVLSLPTTFIFDASGTERFRISGVPSVADLRSALETLT